MSVGSTTASVSNYLRATIAGTTVLTAAGWFYIEDTTANYATLFGFSIDNAATGYYWLGRNAGSTLAAWHGSSGFSTGFSSIANSNWIYAALILNGTSLTGYASVNNGASAMSTPLTVTSGSIISVQALNDWSGADPLGAHFGYGRLWAGALSQAEVDAERVSSQAVRKANLLSDSPLPDTTALGAWASFGTLSNGANSPFVGFPTFWFQA